MKAINRLDYVIRYASASDDAVDITMVARAKTRLGGQGHKIQHLRALDWRKVPAVYRALGRSVAHTALRFYLLTVVRVSNVTNAEWSEFAKEIWTLPESRMKAAREFRVPLSWQASGLVADAKSRFKGDRYVFPSPTAWKKGVISENTWNSWLTENGFDCTAHGFRSSFRDWAAENQVCARDIAEMCIDHAVKGRTEASYFRSDLLEQRAKVMQQWAEFVTKQTADDRAEMLETKAIIALEKQQSEGKVPSYFDWRDVVEDRSDDG
jgi:integrase